MKLSSQYMGTNTTLKISDFHHFLGTFDNQVINRAVIYIHNFDFLTSCTIINITKTTQIQISLLEYYQK